MKPLLSAALFLSAASLSFAQNNVLSIAPTEMITAKAGTELPVKLVAQLKPGYHCNSDKPSEDYLIPLKLTWTPAPLEVVGVTYPKPQMEKYVFSEKPLSVYTGDFDIVTKFKVPASAHLGQAVLSAKLRYQACNDRMCLPPKTLDVSLPITVVK
jgi:hypothetical protein